MRTFYRSLDDLEAAGFVIRPPQKRYGDAGLFGRAYLHLTQKAAALLGFVEAPNDFAGQPASAPEDAVKDEPVVSLTVPSVTVADGTIYKDLIPTTQKRQPGRLPADLDRLLGLGFREFLVFKLMREAKAHGKLLSDVVEASWTHLRRASHPISYLRKLLRAQVDFGYRVRTQRAVAEQKEEQRTHIERTEEAVLDLAGQHFRSSDGARIYRVSDDAKTITIHHRDERHPRVNAGAWASDFLAALNGGHIVACDAQDATDIRPPSGNRARADVNETHVGIQERLSGLRDLLRLKQAGVVPTSVTTQAHSARGRVEHRPASAFSGTAHAA